MNNELLSKILKPFLKSSHLTFKDEITQATTNLQLAGLESIAFYNIPNSEKAENLFHQRLKDSKCRNIITNRNIKVSNCNVWIIEYSDFLTVQKLVCDNLYPDNKSLKLVGITGTNGKTTTSFLAMQIASMLNFPSLSIGTIGIRSVDGVVEKDLLSTTPSYLELRKIIHKYQKSYKFLFIEISSHALDQKRLFDIELELGAWTSFSQDHLDYHKNFSEYFNAKLLLQKNLKNQAIYVPSSETDLIAKFVEKSVQHKVIDLFYSENLSVGFKAKYNQANLGISIALIKELTGHELKSEELAQIVLPDGRFDPIVFGEHIVVVDYAHTPDALENICKTIQCDFSEYNLVIVFGCGGDRDKGKRPLMGSIASRYANSLIVTSDNPRTENPEAIIDDIVSGVNISFIREEDRLKAIQLSLTDLKKKSIVLIAGKGHEDYQEINGVKHHFSDSETIQQIIKEIKDV
ncbi:hypothetical protein A9Q84_21080 [Halobacteriovorax marinus]|uniref:UDP-N-acetylmuramoyl-L-alanyl-D-glutamate--2,6-diaminopimelate ligase n=1 Tax=Halobacteriovorax marinus TaxID=97084 RepID=A0A1Y5F1H5_9BACT|nr:hypothetical protein A9Q84_21080 [Halobacteriovorax marinus]